MCCWLGWLCYCTWLLLQVAGLDVGWHTLLDLKENPATHRLEVVRQLMPGSYPFKFVIDGTWCVNTDYPTYQVGASCDASTQQQASWACSAGQAVSRTGGSVGKAPWLHVALLCLQDGNNINNIITVLPRDAADGAVRERLLSPTGGQSHWLIQRFTLILRCCAWLAALALCQEGPWFADDLQGTLQRTSGCSCLATYAPGAPTASPCTCRRSLWQSQLTDPRKACIPLVRNVSAAG